MDIVRRTMHERPDGWRIIFNNIYTSSTPGFRDAAERVTDIDGRRPQARARP